MAIMQAVNGGGNDRQVEKRTYVVQDGPVKKIIEEEIETIRLAPNGTEIKTAQDVTIGLVDRARAIKLYHQPVVSGREKKKINSLDDKSIFSFLGCFGGDKRAFF